MANLGFIEDADGINDFLESSGARPGHSAPHLGELQRIMRSAHSPRRCSRSGQRVQAVPGRITGANVCDWLPTIHAAFARVTNDGITYSNTALYYILSQLPSTVIPWYTPPNLRVFYAYPF
jgi:hypothetical protein